MSACNLIRFPGRSARGTVAHGCIRSKTRVSSAGLLVWEDAQVSSLPQDIVNRLKRSVDGLVPAIVQQYDTNEVLMLAWLDDEALVRTITTGRATYWSRSRGEYWVKGDTSGHVQWVKEIRLDCDGDTLLFKVDQVGAACHTGERTCFDADVLYSTDG